MRTEGILQRIKGFVGLDDIQKTQLDRRAFLRGMSVTAAGLLVPSTSVFDIGRGGQVVVPSEEMMRRLSAKWQEVKSQQENSGWGEWMPVVSSIAIVYAAHRYGVVG